MTCALTQEISQQAFECIRELFLRESGIRLADVKKALVASRLRRRLLYLAVPDFDAYCRYLSSGQGGAERRILFFPGTASFPAFAGAGAPDTAGQ